MSGKFQRVTQLESAPLSATGAKVFTHQFDGSAGGINWAKSYMHADVTVLSQDGSPCPNNHLQLRELESNILYSPAALIQTVRLSHDMAGVLEENRNINVLNQSEMYVKNTDGMLISKAKEGYGTFPVDASGNGDIVIPMSDLLGMANSGGVFPLDKRGGQCQLQCQLEDYVVPCVTTAAIMGNNATVLANFAVADIASTGTARAVSTIVSTTVFNAETDVDNFFYPGRVVTITYTMGAAIGVVVSRVIQSVAVGAVAGAHTATITFTDSWVAQTAADNLTAVSFTVSNVDSMACVNIPSNAAAQTSALVTVVGKTVNNFVVGNTYTISVLLGIAAPRALYTASAILQSKAANAGTPTNVDLTFAANIINIPATAASASQMVIYLAGDNPLQVQFNQIDLNLYREPGSAEPFEYSTTTLERGLIQNVANYQNQFSLEAGLVGFNILMTEQDKLCSAQILDNLSSYRVAINNVATTNRDVDVAYDENCQLYLDRVKLYYDENCRNLNRMNSISDDNYVSFMIPEKHNSLNNDLVDLRVNSAAAPGTLNLYLFKKKLMAI